MKYGVESLLDLLECQSRSFGGENAFTFLDQDQRPEVMTYATLERRAQSVAVELQRRTRPGDRVLLVYPSGLDFIVSFFGCIYAGVIPLPATYPKPRRPMPRLTSIAKDCHAAMVLTTAGALSSLQVPQSAPSLVDLPWVATDGLPDASCDWRRPKLRGSDLAFLQYTSGSTSEPKGVMVSHANVLHNLAMIQYGNGLRDVPEDNARRVGVFWLPAYHDMGLICGILGTLYEAGHSVILSPTSFLQRPLRWLQAISTYKAEVSGAPNFAYELCVRGSTPTQRADLDLSHWKVAFCSAEPVQAKTLSRFAEHFTPHGFQRNAFYPCYGLAEATLLAAGNKSPACPSVKQVDRMALSQNRVMDSGTFPQTQDLVGCGNALGEQELIIVDPLTCHSLGADQIGEIWLHGASVAQGYWGAEEASRRVFHAQLATGDTRHYLRTGDLGFISSNQLYVTGRLKDVIILRGRNYYPQDIERTVESAHASLAYGGGATFSLAANEEGMPAERLVVVHEVDRQHRHDDMKDVFHAVRLAIVQEHELDVHAVVLIRPASLPRTTSGKPQRQLCRLEYLAGRLQIIAEWNAPTNTSLSEKTLVDASVLLVSPLSTTVTVEQRTEEIESWMLNWLSTHGTTRDSPLTGELTFGDLGLDSVSGVEMSRELEDWLQISVPSVVAWDHPTPHSLSAYLARLTLGETPETTTVPPLRRGGSEFLQLLAEQEACQISLPSSGDPS